MRSLSQAAHLEVINAINQNHEIETMRSQVLMAGNREAVTPILDSLDNLQRLTTSHLRTQEKYFWFGLAFGVAQAILGVINGAFAIESYVNNRPWWIALMHGLIGAYLVFSARKELIWGKK